MPSTWAEASEGDLVMNKNAAITWRCARASTPARVWTKRADEAQKSERLRPLEAGMVLQRAIRGDHAWTGIVCGCLQARRDWQAKVSIVQWLAVWLHSLDALRKSKIVQTNARYRIERYEQQDSMQSSNRGSDA